MTNIVYIIWLIFISLDLSKSPKEIHHHHLETPSPVKEVHHHVVKTPSTTTKEIHHHHAQTPPSTTHIHHLPPPPVSEIHYHHTDNATPTAASRNLFGTDNTVHVHHTSTPNQPQAIHIHADDPVKDTSNFGGDVHIHNHARNDDLFCNVPEHGTLVST